MKPGNKGYNSTICDGIHPALLGHDSFYVDLKIENA
jgi:hypothetical protein